MCLTFIFYGILNTIFVHLVRKMLVQVQQYFDLTKYTLFKQGYRASFHTDIP